MSHATRVDRARGCLLGLAIGDALGAPLEGLTQQQIHSHYIQVTDYVDGTRAWRKKPFRWRLKGLYTDDTQQALALADCLVETGKVDADRLARLFVEMASPRNGHLGAHRGPGKTFRQVIEDLERGVSHEVTGRCSAGIGAAMRIAPVGLYFADHPDQLLAAVMNASLMSHRDIRSLAGALAVASAIALIVDQGLEARRPSFLFQLAHLVHQAELELAANWSSRVAGLEAYKHAMSSSIAAVEPLLDRPRESALSAIVERANRLGAEPACLRPTMGFPPALIATCLYLLLVNDSFEDALIEVVNLGGDADTAGAILGAMSGAMHGVESIPRTWLEGLRNREGILARAEALVGMRAFETIPNFLETERELTECEARTREEQQARRQSEDDLGANRRR